MDKLMERAIQKLPVPIFMGAIAIFVSSWVIKELKSHATYGDVFRDAMFIISFIIITVAILIYYLVKFIVSRRIPGFVSGERGILISRILGDTDGIVQTHVFEAVNIDVHSIESLSNVKVRKVDRPAKDHEEACEIAQTGNAKLCVWGNYMPPSTLYFKLSIPGTSDAFHNVLSDFPKDTSLLRSNVVEYIENVSAEPHTAQSRIGHLERAVDKQDQKLEKILLRIEGIQKQLRNLEVGLDTNFAGKAELNRLIISEKKRRRVVLSIGIGEYQSSPNLIYSSNDSVFFRDLVLTLWQDASVTVLKNSDATRTNILRSLYNISKMVKPNDQVWLYFSGHAFTLDDVGYILPYDGDSNLPNESGISMRDIGKWFQELPAQQAIMFADACYSGEFIRLLSKSGKSYSTIEQFRKSLCRMIITAGGKNDLSYEDQDFGRGVFTHYLFEGLSGDADKNRDGIVTSSELFEYLKDKVMRATSSKGLKQIPTMCFEGEEDFVLAFVQ